MLKSKLLRTVSLIMVTVGLLVLGSTTAFAQSKTVTGKVVDANGPVIGAFVMEQGTNTGASTQYLRYTVSFDRKSSIVRHGKTLPYSHKHHLGD